MPAGSRALSGRDALRVARRSSSSLLRSRNTVESQLQLLGQASVTLVEDGDMIRSTHDEQKEGLRSALGTAAARLAQLQRQKQWDRVVLTLALAFFALVLLWVVGRRLRLLRLIYWAFQRPSPAVDDS